MTAMDLFEHQADARRQQLAPLAERLRPRTLEEFVGQEAILGPGRLLRRAISADRIGSLILHGPPGTGKTTLARIIANTTRCRFTSLNAVLAGIRELREAIDGARERLGRHGLRTLLFVDEVHRFNTAQQDALLPWVENGTVVLIGATTENPFFEVNKALLSRSRLFRLQPLEAADLQVLLERALTDRERGYGARDVLVDGAARDHLVAVAGGDARTLLNALELAVDTTPADADGTIRINLTVAEESIQQQAVLYDKQGDAHFDTISAFIKSIRGSDADAALFWLARMVEAGENPRFLFRRLLIAAGEDIGLADPQAIVVVEACAAAFERMGLPEGLYPLVQATLYLASTEKSNSTLGFFDAVRRVRQEKTSAVPSHLRDGHRDGKAFGDGQGYRYPHAYAEHWVAQAYLPAGLQGEVFWQPGRLGWEGARRGQLQRRRAAQLAAAAEWASEQGESLSSGPADPLLERWQRRQLAQEGERLQTLQQRFWASIPLERQQRVLVLDCRSLLWALPALDGCPEGGAVLQVEEESTAEGLRDQLGVLDDLIAPLVCQVSGRNLAELPSRLPAGQRFERMVGRNVLAPPVSFTESDRQGWLMTLEQLLTHDGRLDLLFSRPAAGPAGLLAGFMDADLPPAVRALTELEVEGLQAAAGWESVGSALSEGGWRVHQEEWREQVPLPITDALLDRWFGPASRYRWRLGPAGEGPELNDLHQRWRQRLGSRVEQPLIHRRITARPGRERTPIKNPAEAG
jgi:putative ATPase